MHNRNPYKTPIDFASLSEEYPRLKSFLVKSTIAGCVTIDFKNVEAQRCLTEALLWRDFGLKISLPENRLCPPVPNRLNYILWIKDVLSESFKCLEERPQVVGIDIGTGASAIYPLLGCKVDSSWKFVGTEIDPVSYASAVKNVEQNNMTEQIRISKVPSSDLILVPFQDEPDGMDSFTFTMCNPPFYADAKEIERSAEGKALEPNSICTGSEVEMITCGGEEMFVGRMFTESVTNEVKGRCLWFSSMVGKLSSLEKVVEVLRMYKVDNYALTELVQGQTRRWVVAWSFSDLRIPDSLGRKLPAAHHALLPPHTNFEQVLHNSGSIALSTLREDMLKVLTVLDGVVVTDISDEVGCIDDCTSEDGPVFSNESLCLRVSTLQNTWTRAARRAAKARSTVLPGIPTAMVVDVSTVRRLVKGTQCWVLLGQWRRGKDYDSFTSFWSHVSRKVCSTRKPAQ